MSRLKITEKQYKKLINFINESEIDRPVRGGGINRIDKSFIKNSSGIDVLKPSDLKINEDEPLKAELKRPLQNVPDSRMTKQSEPKIPLSEDIFSPELHKEIHELIQNIWLNPSQKGLTSTFFVENGVTWGDIISYLTSVGVLAGAGAGIYKIKNIFKQKFSNDKKEAFKQKMEVINKIVDKIEDDPNAPWSKIGDETTYEKKQRLQAKPEPGWKAEVKPYNPNKFKMREDEKAVEHKFKPVAMGKEIAILNGPDAMYVYYIQDENDTKIPENLSLEDLAEYISNNMGSLKKGVGLKDFESGADLVKMDEPLKNKLMVIYGKDKELISALKRLEEMTSASSSGSFVGPFGATNTISRNITRGYTPAKEIGKMIKNESEIIDDEDYDEDENTKTIDETDSSSSGQYTQPKVWAKNKANWAASKRTQYPGGEMVDFDPCTKLNNNKKAQQGKCSQGAIDNVVKTHKTKDSVISKSIYETIAKKTGKSIEEVERIIKTKLG